MTPRAGTAAAKPVRFKALPDFPAADCRLQPIQFQEKVSLCPPGKNDVKLLQDFLS